MVSGMLSRFMVLALMAGWQVVPAKSETLQLKDKAAITGHILARKADQIVMDIGYTVLTVPRNQVVHIIEDVADVRSPAKVTKVPPQIAPAQNDSGLFQSAITPPPERSVRDLVSQLGEAVVQVRTPSGLGSGFIINEDGFLITNFHVIENETQISVEVYHQKAGALERKSYKQVRIMAMNKFVDLALLKIEDKDAPKFARVLLGDSDALAVGDRMFAIGSPLGLERTVTEGILSTTARPM